ncbi:MULTISPECIES: hypothetical protein [unclassified Knoellia]|uniref:hypothetical protein n=1 Tax=Knoellia altitudinis TaxID=3404795 RepID=UPI003612918C
MSPLELRLVGGLSTAETACGFLVTESTMGQRISRVEETLSANLVEVELLPGQLGPSASTTSWP